MGTNVYVNHGLYIRRIALGYERGPGYEITLGEEQTRIPLAEFRKMVLELVKHLMET